MPWRALRVDVEAEIWYNFPNRCDDAAQAFEELQVGAGAQDLRRPARRGNARPGRCRQAAEATAGLARRRATATPDGWFAAGPGMTFQPSTAPRGAMVFPVRHSSRASSTPVDRHRRRRAVGAAVVFVLYLVTEAAMSSVFAARPRLLDAFEDLTPWQLGASDGVRASLHAAPGVEGQALCLQFDFAGVAGYASVRRALPLEFPPNYEFSLDVRGDAPPNTLEFKLIDASGDNVWWVNRPDFAFPRDWQRLTFKKRHIAFAWGPTPERTLSRSAMLELVVKAGSGGRGSACFDQLGWRELPSETTPPPPPVVHATSAQPGAEAARALDGSLATAWRSDPAAGPTQALTVDFQRPREFGGLVLHWLDRAFASRYEVQFSDDGRRWRTVRAVTDGRGGRDYLYLPESETRFLRLALRDGPARAYGLAEIDVKELAFGASPNAFFMAVARDAPRGYFPRGFSGEQAYWTVVGTDGGAEEGLLSEDGALEVGKAGFSIEPFLLTGSALLTWADVQARHSLLDGYLPIPSVAWRHGDLALQITAFASHAGEGEQLIASYELRNLGARPHTATLALAVRPFQVNPPSQFLNTPGGVSPIHELAWDGQAVLVNGARRIFPLAPPDAFAAVPFDGGSIPERLAADALPAAERVRDAFGYASGALVYRLHLPPHGSATIGLWAPLTAEPAAAVELGGLSPAAWLQRQRDAVAAAWRAKLNRVTFRVPPSAQPLVDTLRTALAHILINRDGPALQPGSRAYERSWIRDGALTSAALLRLGYAAVVRDFLRWYAPYQFANGKVPCCVDARGADPVPEHDSHGEFIFLVAELYRYTRDRSLLAAMWPHVEAAAGYLEALRQSERVAANLVPERRAFYGLLPPSISHEGYAAKPMHAYWDDFWALKGYEDAVAIATALGHEEAATRLARQRDEFRRDLYASLAASVAAHGIAYLPGAAELGDFDPTATTIALSPVGEQAHLPPALLRSTFERYWQAFTARRDGAAAWEDYTPYELRTVGTFVRLGWRRRALELLEFFLADRRPPGWNQWAEVVGREPRQPRFLGDLPHGWVASDFIRSTLDLFAYERDADRALVLAAGLPLEWLAGEGVAIDNLHTPYGRLSYSLQGQQGRLVLTVAAGLQPPPGGLILVWPGEQPPGPARLNGQPVRWQGAELRLHHLPAEVVVGD
jgi:hypothetical protein